MPRHRLNFSNIVTTALLLCLITLFSACSPQTAPPQAQEITAGTTCTLDGMLLSDYPGPKAQIHYAEGPPEYFCDTVEMFSILLRPESRRHIRAVYTQDMGKADWKQPRGHWIDARAAFYVQGSTLKGSMGPTFAAFERQEDAEAFVRKHGGKVMHFVDVTPDMADLRGGATHNEHM